MVAAILILQTVFDLVTFPKVDIEDSMFAINRLGYFIVAFLFITVAVKINIILISFKEKDYIHSIKFTLLYLMLKQVNFLNKFCDYLFMCCI